MNRYAGLDWASEIHAVCVIDQTGEVLERLRVPHTRLGLAELVRQLARHADPAELPVGVERSDGPLIEVLRAGGFPVIVIPPHTVKAARPRFSAANVKSDPGDARLLADLVRTDGGRFRVLSPSDPATAALRRLVRTRGELVAERTRLANRRAACSRTPGRGRPRSSPEWTRRSASTSSTAIRARARRGRSARRGWRRSSSATITAADER